MTFAFGHLIGAWLAGKLAQRTKRAAMTRIAWALLLGGAILPDADYLVDWTLGTHGHRTLTHSLAFLLAVPIITCFLTAVLKKKYPFFQPKLYAIAIGLGILTHLLIDMAEGFPGVALFWPHETWYYFFGSAIPGGNGIFESNAVHHLKRAIVDMGLGTAWIGYFVLRDRIRF
ncbi:metal-dependent hydrolase [Candidatus Woesearchaeota archaeon]|nr:metal-dependent hydrolase [Candidatus Woesearchaeota archaeon]